MKMSYGIIFVSSSVLKILISRNLVNMSEYVENSFDMIWKLSVSCVSGWVGA